MTTVNRPTNVKQKEEDVNQKLQLFGIYSGMYTFFTLCTNIVAPQMARQPSLVVHVAVAIQGTRLIAR